MQISKVCKACKLTKKAVLYYVQQGLLAPGVLVNGYRDYSVEDVERLREIAVLRRLGMGISEIKEILDSPRKEAVLARCICRTELELERKQLQEKCLLQLQNAYDIGRAEQMLDAMPEDSVTIREKLLQAFPGSYGLYLYVHFGRFLCVAAETPEQQEAYRRIVQWLDGVDGFDFAPSMQAQLEEAFERMQRADLQKLDEQVARAVEQPQAYLEENQEALTEYLEYRLSDEFRASPAYEMQQAILRFQKNSGYQKVFLENLKRLSVPYRQYCEQLEQANALFLQAFPAAEKLYPEQTGEDGNSGSR